MNQVDWVRGFTADQMGPVFRIDGRFGRAVRPKAADFTKSLFDDGVVQGLQQIGFLNEQSISAVEIEGFAFSIDSAPADFDILPNYYPFELLKFAAIRWLEASIYLQPLGLELEDGHYGNFGLFENAQPRWFDLGSVMRSSSRPRTIPSIQEFVRFFLSPLLAVAKHPELKVVVRNHALLGDRGLSGEEAEYLTGFKLLPYGSDNLRTFEVLKDALSDLSFKWPNSTWSHYAEQRIVSISGEQLRSADDSTREGAVLKLLSTVLRPTDVVLDLGGNDGYFGLHAAAAGASAIISDLEEAALERGLAQTHKNPSWKAAFVSGDAIANSHSCDVMLVLALTHHLRLTDNRYFDMIAASLASKTRRVLIIEYMPWGLSTKGIPDNLPPDYTLENFVEQFRKFFSSVEVISTNVAEAGHPRVLIQCTK